MASEFYRIYNEVLAKSLRKQVKNENNTAAGLNVGPLGDYAPGDARVPKNIFKGMQRRLPLPKGVIKPKEVK